ncbi:hypothetical protein PHMEG_00017093 [Phytophthora megakarya]|uniref:Uncharacterized protein n=1 Tax=Phytophthora megakarya TaxID=4795 RepID=A0A225VXC7_9STRA|nr:hypothetical protein PHMEG_00017093 [Phytophthora megakarya]
MTRENASLVLDAVVEKFGMYLVFKEGRKGQLMTRHLGQVLERYGMKRESRSFVNKALTCTKKSLKMMVMYLYSIASTASNYLDAGLLYLLWYLFGRASDLTLFRKQELSLFSDYDFTACPLLAITLALATPSAPTASLLNQLLEQSVKLQTTLTPTAPLIDLINHHKGVAPFQPSEDAADSKKPADDGPGVHSYVNRVLGSVVQKTCITERLRSHSFRRGGDQLANAVGLCVQLIFDRGAWNMTATNKTFAYVFNTAAEDLTIARVLGNRSPTQTILSLDTFDSDTHQKIQSVVLALFVAPFGLETAQYNVNAPVLETLMAYMLRHYPVLKAHSADGPAIQSLEACAVEKGFTVNDLDEVIRHLRLTLNKTIASASLLSEAIEVIFAALAKRKKHRPTLDDVHEWLVHRVGAGAEEEAKDDEGALVAPEDEPQHYVRKPVNWKPENRTTYYPVDWEPSWESRYNINPTVVAAFEKERRLLLVRKAFIDDEAVEDNSLNATEA